MWLRLIFILLFVCVNASPNNQEIQKLNENLLSVLKHVFQPTTNKEHLKILSEFTLQSLSKDFNTIYRVLNDGASNASDWFLQKNKPFSVFEPELNKVDVLINIFSDTTVANFYKLAIWARENVNEDLFLYSLASVIVDNMKEMILPPIYELNPYYHFPSKVIQEVQNKKLTNKRSDIPIIFDADYSSDTENSVPYFIEDVGINAYYYYFNIYINTIINKGEVYYYFLQQLLARYNLECVSNNIDELPTLEWSESIKVPYNPSIRYPFGVNFPSRPKDVDLQSEFDEYAQTQFWKSDDIDYQYDITDYERRVRNVIKAGSIEILTGKTEYGKEIISNTTLYNDDGINILGEMIRGNFSMFNSKFYGSIDRLGRKWLGNSYSNLNENVPSALEHYETTLRDPAIFMLYKKILSYSDELLEHIPSYTDQDLWANVDILELKFGRLETFFDFFDSDVSNSIIVKPGENVKAFIRQKRLNHKPFNYSISINCPKPAKVAIKIFLGAKNDKFGKSINLNEQRHNFFEFDNIILDLKEGKNVITRQSTDNGLFAKDFTTFNDIYKELEHNNAKTSWERRIKFPRRFMLPKGSKNGVEYQFFAYVYKIQNDKEADELDYTTFTRDPDNHPLGYPLNRIIRDASYLSDLPNAHFLDVKIYHVED